MTEASLVGKSLSLAGFEYNSTDLDGLSYQEQDEVIQNSTFHREIELSFM